MAIPGQTALTSLLGTEYVEVQGAGAIKTAIGVQHMSDYMSKTVIAVTSGQTVTMSNLFSAVLLNLTQTAAALTINLPTAPNDGQVASISFNASITGLTIAATKTINNLPSTASTVSAAQYGWIYDVGSTTWWRIV